MTQTDNGCLTALVFSASISTQADNKRNGAGTRRTLAERRQPDFTRIAG